MSNPSYAPYDLRTEQVQDVPLFEAVEATWPTTTGLSPAEHEYDRLVSGVPDLARPTDPGTSHAAASSITAEAHEASERFVLNALTSRGPLTDEMLVHVAQMHGEKWSPSRIRTARAQLVRKGLVEDSGLKALTDSGRKAIEWMVTA